VGPLRRPRARHRDGSRRGSSARGPACVVHNWAVEVWKFTTLPSRILHGLEREPAFDLWLREGGVAITSCDTFRTMGRKGRIPPVALR